MPRPEDTCPPGVLIYRDMSPAPSFDAKNILAQEEQGRRILDQVENEKTLAAVREVVTLKKKKISVEKFRELK